MFSEVSLNSILQDWNPQWRKKNKFYKIFFDDDDDDDDNDDDNDVKVCWT